MIYYEFDKQGIYTNPIEIDIFAALPQNAVNIEPPVIVDNQVAKWDGVEWIILNERPVFIEPEPLPEVTIAQNFPLAKIDFLRLFTQAERVAIKQAAKVNPIIEDYQYMLDNSSTVLLTDPDIQEGVPLLETAGLIGPGRAAQILAGQPPE